MNRMSLIRYFPNDRSGKGRVYLSAALNNRIKKKQFLRSVFYLLTLRRLCDSRGCYNPTIMKTRYSLILITLSWYCTSLAAFAQSEHIPADHKMPSHPRILLLKGGEEGIRQNLAADDTWQKLHGAILEECDTLLEEKPLERIQVGRRLLSVSRECLRRVFYLSYAWRISQQEKYLKRAEQELLAVAAFSDWNPSHFLDVAEMTMAVAIGYDWLFDALPEASKSIIKEAILKKGIEPSLDPKHNGWLKATHNWNQVCNAGMTYGALAIYEDHPELARRVINRAIETIVLPMEDYAPDGAYPEGYSYWGYGTSFNVMFISAIEKVYGQDFGLSDQPGFLRTASYMLHMTGPSGDPYNYGDAGLGGELQPAMFWFADRLQDPSLLWVEKSRLIQEDAKEHTRNRLLPATMIWNGGVRINQITAPASNIWVGQGKNPVALMRTSWTNPGAIYVGMKGGSPSVNHAHMDVGSFIMEASGIRWAMDFGMQNYHSLESKGVQLWGRAQDAQRWQVFRYNNFVHNTLTVNNELQRVEGYAAITARAAKPAFISATTDISELYKGYLQKANRGIAIVDQQYVTVRDELEAAGQETTIRWTLLTSADVKITGKNTAELTKDGKKLLLKVTSPKQVTMKTWSTDPPRDYDAENPGTIMTGFETKIKAGEKGVLNVLLIPDPDTGKAEKQVKPLKNWPQ